MIFYSLNFLNKNNMKNIIKFHNQCWRAGAEIRAFLQGSGADKGIHRNGSYLEGARAGKNP